MNIQSLTLLEVQPSQFYISEDKLHGVEAWLKDDLQGFEPIPVKLLDGIPVMTDGHTRAVAALRRGWIRVPMIAETDDLDWEMYQLCVDACRKQNVFTPKDLMARIISAADYRRLWDEWCDEMQEKVIHGRSIAKNAETQRAPDYKNAAIKP